MVVKRLRRSAPGICLFLMSTLLLMIVVEQSPRRSLPSPSEYVIFWSHAKPLEDGRYPGEYVPFVVVPVEEERLLDTRLEESVALTRRESRVVPRLHAPGTTSLHYTHSPPPPLPFTMLDPRGVWTPWRPQLSAVGDYFKYLKTPQVYCRKLIRMGGHVTCKRNQMDGHKYLCFDAPLRLVAPRNSQRCLVLSYGVQMDTSFDEAVVNLPCDVHMFDVLDFSPELAREEEHAYFHNEGLANSDRVNYFDNIKLRVKMDTLRNHVKKLGLQGRLIHVLKMDIENSEWESLTDIAEDPLFDAVGQVAVEVHAIQLVGGRTAHHPADVPREKWLEALQSRYDVFRMIEARGFRRVLYWDNVQDDIHLVDDLGVRYETAGELLYVNTNWSNATFMHELERRGFNISRPTSLSWQYDARILS
ncbi:uncharacterized protein LOC127003414 [Eriocheir sinensis]|uniref:uncharacterized protein LOC127003414 n=1 Tax=Eriocheir sinensis TaxID=95602 RepID=UPI0021C7A81E|nr:uncharacterized protein LOC127003414 [Eriocheir sinensis]